MKKLLIIIIIFIAGFLAFSSLFSQNKPIRTHSTDLPHTRTIVSTDPVKQETIITNPTTLRIPKLGIDAVVEHVGMDSEGRMDVPKNNEDVAWYQLGHKPGEEGNAVFAGHYDTKTGSPAVFYYLATLTKGDKVVIGDSSGKSLTFVVTNKENYPYNDFPLQEVFGDSSKERVNLITCEGTWNASSHNYSHRTVVYTQRL